MRVCFACGGQGSTAPSRPCSECAGRGITFTVANFAAADEIYESARLALRYLRSHPPAADAGEMARRQHARALSALSLALSLVRQPAAPAPLPKKRSKREKKGPQIVLVTPPDAQNEPRLELIYHLVGELDQGAGAPWEDIVARAKADGLTEDEVESLLNTLMDRDLISEPVLGRLRRR